MLNTLRQFCYSPVLSLLVGTLLLNVACSDSNDELPEDFIPLNCTIPGELQLDGDTKDMLNKYKR